ncbi:hypothetical protein EON82_19650 [bacterium]|nr:MAG: hypothetical protein EON82_19650 [bacterium]
MSGVARHFGISPSLVFLWKRQMDDGVHQALAVPLRDGRGLREVGHPQSYYRSKWAHVPDERPSAHVG